MSTAPNSLIGQTIADRYHVLSLIGEGGMGRVYLAEHVKMGRKSALKVLSPELAFSAEAISRFHREAANASRINHPNVAAIYDFGETSEGMLYLAMEFVEGETLRGMLSREPRLDVMRSAKLIKQAADALAAAHHLGIVHRDLKPDNIMVARNIDGTDLVKVVDFGIAKTVDEGSGSQTLTTVGVSIGTPEYMSPEQLAGEKLDARTDVYSLALVLFNMLTGTLPYPKITSRETLVRRLTLQPRRLRDVAPDIDWPVELQRALDRALAPYVEDRYSSANEFGLDVLAAALSMHNQRSARLQSDTPDGATRRVEPVTSVTRTRPMVGTLIVIMALATLLIRAEPANREPRKISHLPVPAASDSETHDSTTVAKPDSTMQVAALDARMLESATHLTADSTQLAVPNATKALEHGDSLKAPATDSVKLTARDSVRPASRDSVKTTPRDSLKPAVHDSVRTAKRDSIKPVARETAKPAKRDSSRTQSRDSSKAAPQPRDSTKAPTRDSAKTPPRDSLPTGDSAALRPRRLLRRNGDSASALAEAMKNDTTRAAADSVRGHFEKARALLIDGKPAEAQIEFRDAALQLRTLRTRLDTAAARELDQVLHRLRQQSHDACVAAREKAADSTAAAGYQCERILARPGALGRQGGAGAAPDQQ